MSKRKTHKSKILKRKKRVTLQALSIFVSRWVRKAVVVGLVMWLGAWLWFGGVFHTMSDRGHDAWLDYSSDVGFRVERIMVEGRENLDGRLLMSVIDVQQGDALFGSQLVDIHERLEALSWVKSVVVQRRAPHDLYIRIEEKVPVVLFVDTRGSVVPLDIDGNIIDVPVASMFNDYLLVSGDGVNDQVHSLMSVLVAYPDLRAQIDMAEWVGNRRWNFVGKNKMLIKMPDKNIDHGLARLKSLHDEKDVLLAPLDLLDLRYSDRVIVRSSDDESVREVGYEL
jgi:cell division protein FtsQ